MANTVDVQELRNDAVATTNAWTAIATGFIDVLQDIALGGLDQDLPPIGFSLPSTPYEGSLFGRLGNEPNAQANSSFASQAGSDPGTVNVQTTVSVPDLVDMPDYDLAAPTLDIPARPSVSTPTAPTAPTLDGVAVPAAPTIELPTAPTIAQVEFPEAPTLALPVFSEAAPDVPTSFLQTLNFEYQDEYIDETLLNDIRSKLSDDVNNGGYGIESTDEDAIWARARDREIRELESTETEIEELYAGRGYFIPPGAMLNAYARARTEADRRLSEVERELTINRAALFRDNRQFAIQQGLATEDLRLRHWGFRMERALNVARFTAEYAIQAHDAYIRQFNAELDRYTAIANVFKTRLDAALVQVQIYEAEVRAAVAKQEASRLDVELYRALIEASNARVSLYETEVRAASVLADLQRLKADAFRSEVQAFVAQVQANEAQLGVYEAGIRGEQAKLDIFRTEVAAYADRIRAAGIEQSSRNERSQVQIQAKRAELEEYQSDLERYKTKITEETSRVRALLERYSSDTSVFQSAINGYEALTRLSLGESDAQIRAINEITKRLQANAEIDLDRQTKELTLKFNAANAGSQLATGIISGVQSSIQGLAVEAETTST